MASSAFESIGQPAGSRHVSSRFVALGFDFEIETADFALGRYLDAVLKPFACQGRGAHRYELVQEGVDQHFALYFEGERKRRSGDGGTVLAHLFWHINSQVISQSTSYVLVHAAGAELHGQAVVLPAESGSGKSTLVAGLVLAGFRYLTDEAVAFDPVSGEVVPFPKPLNVGGGTQTLLPHLHPALEASIGQYATGDWMVDVGTIRADAFAPPSVPAFVIGPTYRQGTETRLVPLRPAETAMLLIQNALNLPVHRRAGLGLLADIARRTSGFRLEVGSLDEACSLIAELINRSGPRS